MEQQRRARGVHCHHASGAAMSGRKRTRRASIRHVRIDAWEMDTPAYRTMSTDAVALLNQFRATIGGEGDNRIFLSIRDMMYRLNCGQRRATAARDELIERGWIVLLERGAFSRKLKHASVYGRTDVPLPGEKEPRKTYMHWTPSVAVATTEITPGKSTPQKNTVAKMTTDGSQNSYRGGNETPDITHFGSQNSYREPDFPPLVGSRDSYTSTSTTQGACKKEKQASDTATPRGDAWTR